MCTAVNYQSKDHYFGRNLDWEYSYGERIITVPRRYPIKFKSMADIKEHYAIIGMGITIDGYPMYFDAVNEKGIAVAGLNFHGNACYFDEVDGKDNVTPYEIILWILAQCDSLDSAKRLLENANITNVKFNEDLDLNQMHWIISSCDGSITVEQTKNGLSVYDNPCGVLTNNPPFPMQMHNLSNYMGISVDEPENTFSKKLGLDVYSRGMGGLGLPGDFSSQSRFVKGTFVSLNASSFDDELSSVNQFFHILASTEQPKGCVRVNGKYEYTVYSSCMNTDKCVYYYKTYEDSSIRSVSLWDCDIESNFVNEHI